MKLIAMSLLKQIIEALPNICSSYYEATLFASIFHYHYLAVLRIEKIVQSEISDHTLEVDVICIHYMQNIINVTMNSSKTDEYGKKETLQISKNIERNIAHFKTLNYF